MDPGEPQEELKGDELELNDKFGVGDLLKTEREKKGLTIDQIAQTTRLRQHFLEALEKEEWDQLPAPVFIKGFIRSYALALGLDKQKIFDLYEKSHPAKEVPQEPLVEHEKSKKGALVILLLLFATVLVLILLFRDGSERSSDINNKKTLSEVPVKPSEKGLQTAPEVALEKSEIENGVNDEGSETEVAQEPELEKAKKMLAQQDTEESAIDESVSTQTTLEPVLEVDWLVLKGIIKERTWIKIYIDDEKPKEYIFQTGSRPQWEAREGFNILVGNAAGVEFDFNGKKIGDLGKLGQVVRLKLPENFEARFSEE